MYKLNEEKMFYDIADGQAVVIDYTTGMYYGTSKLGSAVLDALINGASEESVADIIKAENGCPDNAKESLSEFIDALLNKEIIVKKTGEGSAASIGQDAFSEGFALELNEYAEVQELLLADPVHEVDVEQGWPIMKEDM